MLATLLGGLFRKKFVAQKLATPVAALGIVLARRSHRDPVRMMDVEPLIETLLLRRPRGFRNKHFADAVGLSRSRASQLTAACGSSCELVAPVFFCPAAPAALCRT